MTAVQAAQEVTGDDLRALREAVGGWLADGAAGDTGWQRLTGQLGLTGLVVAERYGGAGGGFVELGAVLGEMGAARYAGPFLATSLAAWALGDAADPSAVAALLAGLAAGHRRGAVAPGLPGAVSVTAVDGVLRGTARGVLDADGADCLAVAAVADGEEGLYLVAAPGFDCVDHPTIDPARRLADVRLDGVAATRLGDASRVVRLRAAAAVAVACEQVGGAEAALDDAVGYAKVRTQFGRAIGSFQSIKHLCADVLLAVSSARAAARRAAQAVDDEDPESEVLASIAKAWCSEAYVQAAQTSLQIHGGTGFTWEHNAHLHLTRAKIDEHLFGDAHHHREHLARLLELS